MKLKEFIQILPLFPLSVLVFYIGVVFLWSFNIIPQPTELISFVENIHGKFGLLGLFITAVLEGTAYFGLYFPGTSIIALFFLFSDGNFLNLVWMVLTGTLALTLCSIINYWMGRFFFQNKNQNSEQSPRLEKSIFFSVLHPDLLAFYFFHRGLRKKNFWKVFYVPLALIPYGFFVALVLSLFSDFIKTKVVGNPVVVILAISFWFSFSLILKNKKDFLQGCKRIYKSVFH